MQANLPHSEGYIPYGGYSIWYGVVGDLSHHPPGLFPLLALHGAPISHEALEGFESLADTGRPVIFYDQLGCGNSGRPTEPELWTMQRYVHEIAHVRAALGLDRVHLLGHSWGGMVAMEYALTQPPGLLSLIVASAGAGNPLMDAEAARLRSELPAQTDGTTEETGETGEGPDLFTRTYICRIDPPPDFLLRSATPDKLLSRPQHVPSPSGPNWDITSRLGEIEVPTLITSGRYDMVTPAVMRNVHEGIPGSEWVLFDQSSHYPHAEEPELYLATVNSFLSRVEQALPDSSEGSNP